MDKQILKYALKRINNIIYFQILEMDNDYRIKSIGYCSKIYFSTQHVYIEKDILFDKVRFESLTYPGIYAFRIDKQQAIRIALGGVDKELNNKCVQYVCESNLRARFLYELIDEAFKIWKSDGCLMNLPVNF